MDCTAVPGTHVKLVQGDENSAQHLQVSRKLQIGASVDLEVCDADLVIKGGKDELLRVAVDIENDGPASLAGDYLEVLDVSSQTAAVKLHLPKRPRAKLVITVPPAVPMLQLKLVRGDLSFETERIRGDRKLNVISGHVDILANADTYSALNTSVLMGSFHDHRNGGEHAHGMVSKSLSGTGKGSIDLNVVRGSVDVRAWD